MEKITVNAYVNKLNAVCKQALTDAAGLCVTNGSNSITIEHLLIKLFEQDNDISLILPHFRVSTSKFITALQQSIYVPNSANISNVANVTFSKQLVDLIESAWLIASLTQGLDQIRSGSLLLALLAETKYFSDQAYYQVLSVISYDGLLDEFSAATQDSPEQQSTSSIAGPAAGSTAAVAGDDRSNPHQSALDKYCINLTKQAQAGAIDPVLCRDNEIQQLIDILARRRKNNPICVGEAGVGKTAVVEGLALKLAQQQVPDTLKNLAIYTLDLGLLQAGAGVKGEFEQRLKAVIQGVKAAQQPIVLFIDEAHTLIGAGGQAGGSDAANLLKPALARGELRTIAATTWSEYKQYFEKDAALARRFQLVKLDEPSVEQAVTIIRGIRHIYERAHGVYVRDDAVQAAATLAARYINGRQLPDKAVDVLDTAAARVKISIEAKPAQLEQLESQQAVLSRQLEALQRDIAAGIMEEDDQISSMTKSLSELKEQIKQLTPLWHEQQQLAKTLLQRRQALLTASPDELADLHTELTELKSRLTTIQHTDALVSYEVCPQVVAQVIEQWTGIPVGNMVKDEAQLVLNFATELGQRIKGQPAAVAAIDKGLRAAKAGINNPDAPLGVYLFVGPSGVGKTETCHGIADLLFGGERFLTTINMSEFQERHAVSRLIGSPPGYVGYGEGGILTEAVRQRPYSLVLLDEVEKADPEIMNLFYQVFDKGMLSDGEGQLVDFKNTMICLTSNLASEIMTELCCGAEKPSISTLIDAIKPTLTQYFKPALLARMQIVPFYTIDSSILAQIVQLKLAKVADRIATNHQLQMTYSPQVVDEIVARCSAVDTGARNIDHILQDSLLPAVADSLLSRFTNEDVYQGMSIDLDLDLDQHGQWLIQFSEHESADA